MARKAAWEDASDLGPYAKARGTSWARVFFLVLLVAMGTFVAAYYLPLYRAQEKLAQQYRDLSQKLQSSSDFGSKAEAELKSVTDARDQLQAEHDKHESALKAGANQLEHLLRDLSAKLDKYLKKGSALLTAGNGSVLVAFDDSLLFPAQKLELSAVGRGLLCEVAKSAQNASLRVNGSMAEQAIAPSGLAASYVNPWALSAARAAAVAQALETKCSVPAAQLSATGYGKHDPFLSRLANSKAAAERVVIEIRLP